ncbi:MAG TPA: hypothetical protein VFS02_09750 [Telluria sp.]|nr:hypothetical protein [Telluria sp.]
MHLDAGQHLAFAALFELVGGGRRDGVRGQQQEQKQEQQPQQHVVGMDGIHDGLEKYGDKAIVRLSPAFAKRYLQRKIIFRFCNLYVALDL